MVSLETYILSKKYTDKQILSVEEVAIQEAVAEAVAIAKDYTDTMVGVAEWKIIIVSVLPPLEEADTHTVYLVPMSGSEENNVYYEYIFLNGSWEMLGSTEFKLSDYMTKEEVMEYVNTHQFVLAPATADTLGGVKIDTHTIKLQDDGKISVVPIEANDIANLFY